MPISLGKMFEDVKKILDLAEKPSGDDFMQILKITFLGLAAIGLLSFAITLAITYILQVAGLQLPGT